MKVLPEYIEAIKRGIILDVGHGKAHFHRRLLKKLLKKE